MPKTTKTIDPAPLAAEIARFLDQRGTRAFDGHLVIDFAEGNKIGGRVLHAHDSSTVLTFGLTVTVS